MFIVLRRAFQCFAILALASAPIFLAGAGPAQAASLAGEWVGDGVVEPRDGQRERVRCRINYRRITSNVYSVSARCASPSGRIDQTGEVVRVSGNRYVGDFYNAQFDVKGRARVIISGNRQSVTVSGDAGRGRLNLRKR